VPRTDGPGTDGPRNNGPLSDARRSGWRGIGLIAITYVYFLIFAQFAFLKRLAELGLADAHLKIVMAAMAGGGVLLSLLAPRFAFMPSPQIRLRAGLCACAVAALLTLLPLGLIGSIAVSGLIGSGLGLLTVTLVTYLRLWLGARRPLLEVGLGTGIGYFICNFPPLFTASPQVQAVTAAMLCLCGVLLTLGSQARPSESEAAPPSLTVSATLSLPQALACFTALVWLDSAAFFIIQSTPALKAGTWGGTLHLWVNGALHLLAALASAYLLRTRGLRPVIALAFGALAAACLLLLAPNRAILASAFYPVGVSLYSVALVAYPSLLARVSSTAERGRQAGWIYAIAGWFGSAMGIGMGKNLGHVPPAFVAFAGALILAPQLLRLLRSRRREAAATLVTLTAALLLERGIERGVVTSHPIPLTAAERGRQVYIAEGCISCHSQYVRPHTPDVLLWGPAESIEQLRRERPPLIGNRRQGPDLSAVGGRRSPLWLKAHFYAPSEVSYRSFMPSYAYLFQTDRGNDLIAYLETLRGDGSPLNPAQESAWHLSPASLQAASPKDGAHLYGLYCATCHSANGATRRAWQTSFRILPPELGSGSLLPSAQNARDPRFLDSLAHLIKFGLPPTDMPGHEYLPDAQVASLSRWLALVVPPTLLTPELHFRTLATTETTHAPAINSHLSTVQAAIPFPAFLARVHSGADRVECRGAREALRR